MSSNDFNSQFVQDEAGNPRPDFTGMYDLVSIEGVDNLHDYLSQEGVGWAARQMWDSVGFGVNFSSLRISDQGVELENEAVNPYGTFLSRHYLDTSEPYKVDCTEVYPVIDIQPALAKATWETSRRCLVVDAVHAASGKPFPLQTRYFRGENLVDEFRSRNGEHGIIRKVYRRREAI
eukprot:gnl/TRDRNA2_/TRDRNA2_155455_c1_seq1.p1 gnl/TRDRNA2_/TRDRNA2_155455_c1~~gnl/TRDRNA2_/TRDRNA2_155455_c1_seq1.p1  ORF type:complete len:177 (+),score=14.89 gnl/TRDRNA2_/TRDRNA2_155455_c1_seq1:117-647(+)